MNDKEEIEAETAENDWRSQAANELERLCSDWKEAAPDFELDEARIRQLKILLRRFSEKEVSDAIFIAVENYVYKYKQSYAEAWERIGGVCYNRRNDEENPEQAIFRHLRNILRSRFGVRGSDDDNYSNELAFEYLDLAERRGTELKSLEGMIRNAPTFMHFTTSIIRRVRAEPQNEEQQTNNSEL